MVGGIEGSTADDGVSTQTYDRVVRIVSWIFLLTTTGIVAATGLWPETQPAILILLAFSGIFIVIVHDLLPADALGPAKFVVEGSVAITVATLLVALTGGVAQPVLLRLPAHRRRGGTRRHASRSRSRSRLPPGLGTSSRSLAGLAARARSDRRRRPRSG